jgi:NADH:ubiquinone oxidoreductase subunit 3 (subunit A)
MAEKLEEIDYRIIYLSFLIIMFLAVAIHLSYQETQSLIALAFIILIALSNIGYLYSKRKKPEKK